MKTYLDNQIKLKEPTLGMMCDVGEIIRTYSLSSTMAGAGLKELLKIVCEGDPKLLLNADPSISKEILTDFFLLWKPMEWISDNTSILPGSKKLLQKLRETSKDIEQLSGQE